MDWKSERMIKSSPSEDSVDSELLCAICLGGLKRAKLCGQCGTSFCEEHIWTWLLKNRICPHCRAPMTLKSLGNGRILDQLAERLRSEKIRDENGQLCIWHGRKKEWFDVDDYKTLCSDCVILPQSDQYRKVQDVIAESKQKVDSAMDSFEGMVNTQLDALGRIQKETVEQLGDNQRILKHTEEMIAVKEASLKSWASSYRQRCQILLDEWNDKRNALENLKAKEYVDEAEKLEAELRKSDRLDALEREVPDSTIYLGKPRFEWLELLPWERFDLTLECSNEWQGRAEFSSKFGLKWSLQHQSHTTLFDKRNVMSVYFHFQSSDRIPAGFFLDLEFELSVTVGFLTVASHSGRGRFRADQKLGVCEVCRTEALFLKETEGENRRSLKPRLTLRIRPESLLEQRKLLAILFNELSPDHQKAS